MPSDHLKTFNSSGTDSESATNFDYASIKGGAVGVHTRELEPGRPHSPLASGASWWKLGTAGFGSDPNSQYNRRHAKGWKPKTLGAPMLGGFVLVTVATVVLLEILSRRSSRKDHGGGISFARDVDDIPLLPTFGYLYFPTILAVLYSMMWSWVDLDVKRLEPWFQLSNTDGAEGKESLLLKYPFDFLPFVPITALRRKHWGVFFAGTIMLLVFWAITPLQSSIFTTGSVSRFTNTSMVTIASLVPTQNQAGVFNVNFLNTAYGISWLGQKLPAFATYNRTVLPFQPVKGRGTPLPSETWTSTTRSFSTELDCMPADVTTTPLGYTFRNGKGCIVPDMSVLDTQGFDYMIDYIGYFDDPNADRALQGPNCSSKFSNSFLALWASNSSRKSHGLYSNMTAIFCETKYHMNDISVTVNASNFGVVEVQGINMNGSNASDDISASVNTTMFEYILGSGINPSNQNVNIPYKAVLQQYPRLENYSITGPVSNMVGFAIGLNTVPLEQLSNPIDLGRAFERAHQLLFSTAISSLSVPLDKSEIGGTTFPGVVQDNPGAIILVRPVAIVVEVGLILVAALTVMLWSYTRRRSSHLTKDPSSLSDVIYTLHRGGVPLEEFEVPEDLTDKSFGQSIASRTYRLIQPAECYEPSNVLHETSGNFAPELRSAQSTFRAENAPTTRPAELHLGVGVPFILSILLCIIGLVTIYKKALSDKGLSLPSNNPVVLSILENYLPTLFATFFEPLWVVLNRVLCLLKPFEELRQGNAKATKSLEARYTSLPPPFVIWRAVLSGHFLLAGVCVAAVSTNLLAVALSTLLNERPSRVAFPASGSEMLLPEFNGTHILNVSDFNNLYQDHFYVALANLTGNTTLIPWTDSRRFYLPIELQAPPAISGSVAPAVLDNFRVSTTGFGAKVSCLALQEGRDIDGFQFSASQDGMQAILSTSHLLPNGSRATCVPREEPNGTVVPTGAPLGFPTGKLAMEFMQPMFPAGNKTDHGFCSNLVVAGWARASASLASAPKNRSDVPTFSLRSSDASFIACRIALTAAKFEVTVAPSGHVLTSNQTTDFSGNNIGYFKGRNEFDLLHEAVHLVIPGMVGLANWHNGSFTSDWMNSLLVFNISQDLVDPQGPVANTSIIIPILEGMYEELFALLLGLNLHVFTPATSQQRVEVQAFVSVSRLFVAPAMFRISIVILSFHLFIAVMYYSFRPKRFLPRMPTSLAAIISYMPSSRAAEDCADRSRKGALKEQRYAFGRYMGTDKRSHVGIERQRYVVPLKSRNPAVRRRRWGRTFENKDEKEPRTWI